MHNIHGIAPAYWRAHSVEAEIERQIEVLENGGTIEQETRGYDVEFGKTFRLRGKETAHDYRYMPEPDLPTLILTEVSKHIWRDSYHGN